MQTADKYSHARIETTLAKAGVSSWPGTTVNAYLNHGRWVADCPCNGAELVAPGQEMLCGSCGARHTVMFPDPETLERIVGLLDQRPPANQNWKHETVDQLTAENIEHGLFPEDY